jgi:hypothetical protein
MVAKLIKKISFSYTFLQVNIKLTIFNVEDLAKNRNLILLWLHAAFLIIIPQCLTKIL